MMEEYRVIIADEEATARPIMETLQVWDAQVKIAAGGIECLDQLRKELPSLALIGTVLPDMPGLEVLVRIRNQSPVPVVMIGNSTDTAIRMQSYELGADGYLGKPVDTAELLARCTVLRQRNNTTNIREKPRRFSWDNITIDFPSRTLMISGLEIPLSPTEFNLLWELAANHDTVVTFEHILEKIWANEYGAGREAVYAYVKRLRAKIEKDPHNPRYILAKSRIGYRLAVNTNDNINDLT
jgi:DNA-binding response OmpR family regulator